ncbi:hypothetical protein MauCBS54593_000249 [Microsporum audouinii]
MLSQKIKHHRVASSLEEADQSFEIQLEPTEVRTPAGASEISSSTGLLAERNIVNDTRRLWEPVFLRRPTLLSFAVLFIVLLAALTAVWRISEKEQGLSTVNPSNYYLWTYGPTAVFTIVSALWGQVEYRALQLFPWRLMARGLVSASDSVLLDYLSSWNVWALFKSVKRGHFMVSVSIAVSLVIKLMTVLSTGLFTAKDVQLELIKDFHVQKVFNGGNFNQSAVDARVYYKMWGVAKHNLSNPAGTTGGHAFENFFYDTSPTGTPIYLQNTTYQATVDVFTPSLECQEASVTTHSNITDVGLHIDDCAVVIPGESFAFSPLRMALGSCDGNIARGVGNYPDDFMDAKNTDWRLWIYISGGLSEEPNGHPIPYYSYPNTTFAYAKVIGLMCKLSYSTNRGNVTLTGSGDIDNPSVDLTIAHPVQIPGLANVSASRILYGSYFSVDQAATLLSSRDPPYLILDTGTSGLKNLFDVNTLTDRVTDTFHALAVQLASEYLMAAPSSSGTGTVKGRMGTKQTRLTVRSEAAYSIISILGLLVLVSLLFCHFFLPSAVCPRDPGSIGGLGTILANSHEFMDALSGMGHTSKTELQKALAGQSYITTAKADTFLIKPNGPEIEKSAQLLQPSWWRPFAAGPLGRALVLLVPICLIIGLEILYQKSRSLNGLADVNISISYLSYTWTYIPPLVMLGVRALYECVYFNARVFQPYHELKRGHASPETSIMDNQHRNLAIVGVWGAITKRQWSVMAAGVAVLIAPSLPIIVSGLYTVANVASASEITLTQMNRVNMSDGYIYSSTSDTEDIKLGDMTIQYNLSYPQWTYQDLSFPKLKVNQHNLSNETVNALNNRGCFIKAQVPGLRLDMGCKEIPPDTYVAGRGTKYPDEDHIIANITTLVENCSFRATDLVSHSLLPGSRYFNGFIEPRAHDIGPSGLPSSCPGFVVMYGKLNPTQDTVEAITVLKCRSRIEQVDVSIQLSYPSYAFDLSSPPSVVPGSATTLFDGFMGSMREPVAPSDAHMASAILDLYPWDNSTQDLSLAFKSIIHGEAGISASALLDADILKVRLQKVWGIITAQMINSRGRQDYDDPAAASSYLSTEKRPMYSASLNNPFSTRLFQNMVSTRMLQAVLAAMTLCGAISIFLMDTRKVLPKSPLSIAAAASLLSDSRILNSGTASSFERSKGIIPPGSEWCNDEQLKQRGVFQGRTFTLGWWGVEGNNGINDSESQTQRDTAVSSNGVDSVSRRSMSIQSDVESKSRKRFGIDTDDINHFDFPV